MTPAASWLVRRAERTPDRLALVAGGDRLTFADLLAEARRVAAQMQAAGAGPGDRVALWMDNGAAFVAAFWALSLFGATAVPMNTRLGPEEARWQLDDVRPVLLCHDASLSERSRDSAPQGLSLLAVGATGRRSDDGVPASSAPPVPPIPSEDAVAGIVYTSGTTGRPKGALVTYANLWHGAVGQAMTLGASPDDRWLACLPLFHVSGLAMLTRSVLYGAALFVHERFDAARVNADIDREGITALSVVANVLSRLLDERAGRPYPASLRLVLAGGGPVPLGLLERCRDLGVPVATTYGLTETASQAATLAPWEVPMRLGSAGKALFATDVRVVREDGSEAAAGEAGEILVCGPTVTPGYFERSDATACALAGGWLHTGDVGWLDGEGYLYVADRRDDLVVTGGENVYPAEVEEVLMRHPDVEEAAVVGVSDAEWGQAVTAAVVARAGRSPAPDALRAFCAAHLAGYKVPRRIRLVEALPRTASGKLLRRRVREGFADA